MATFSKNEDEGAAAKPAPFYPLPWERHIDGDGTLYKVTAEDGAACNGGNGHWSLPRMLEDGTWEPGDWMPEVGYVRCCESGYHLTDEYNAFSFCVDAYVEISDTVIWEAERFPDSLYDEQTDKIAVSSARLLKQVWATSQWRQFLMERIDLNLIHSTDIEPLFPGDEDPRGRLVFKRFSQHLHGTAKEWPISHPDDVYPWSYVPLDSPTADEIASILECIGVPYNEDGMAKLRDWQSRRPPRLSEADKVAASVGASQPAANANEEVYDDVEPSGADPSDDDVPW